MKKTFRSSLSLLSVLALLMALLAIGGFPVIAQEETNAKISPVSSSALSVGNTVTLTPGTGNGFSASIPAGGTVGSTYDHMIYQISYSSWSTMPYLILDIAPTSTALLHVWLSWNNQTWFHEAYSSAKPTDYAGVTSIDLSSYLTSNAGDTVWVYFYLITNIAGERIDFDNLYLSTKAIPPQPEAPSYLYSTSAFTLYDGTVAPGANGGFTATVNANAATGYALVDVPVSAALRDTYRYMKMNIVSGTANLHVWTYWQSTGGYTTLTPYSNVAPSTYVGETTIDLQSVTPENPSDTLVVRIIVLGARSGVGAAGEAIVFGGLTLYPDTNSITAVRLLPQVSANPSASTDGGWYTTIGTFTAVNHGDYGIAVTNTSTSTYCGITWALPVSRLVTNPYLVLEVDQAATTQTYINFTCNDLGSTTGEKIIYSWKDVSTIDGRVVINLYDLLGTTTPNQYVYFGLTLLETGVSTLALSRFYLSDNANGDPQSMLTAYHLVQFATSGGSTILSQMVPSGQTADAVDAPVKSGYTFGGWYADAAYTTPFSFTTPITADTTVYAKWNYQSSMTQAFVHLPADTASGTTGDLRLIAGISQSDFAQVGFVYSYSSTAPTVGADGCYTVSTTALYDTLILDNRVIKAADLNRNFLFTCVLPNIPSQDFVATLYVRPYVQETGGAYQYDQPRAIRIADCLSATPPAYTQIGISAADATAAFFAAFDEIGQTDGFFVPAGNHLVAANPTVSSAQGLVVERGGQLTVETGATLTVNGSVEAGAYPIFSGGGTVAGTIPKGYPQWFGAAGYAGTDNTAALQKAVNVLVHMLIPATDSYYYFQSVTLTRPIVIEGVGDTRTKMCNIGTGHTFIIKSSNVTIKNLYIWGNGGTAPEAAAYYFDTSAGNLTAITLDNCYADYSGYFVKDAQSPVYTITNATFHNVFANNNSNIGIKMTDFHSGIVLNDVLINYTPNHAGLYVENCQGMDIRDLDVAFGYGVEGASGGDGAVFNNCANVTINRAMVDYINGICLKISNSTHFEVNNWVSSLYSTYGFAFDNVTNSTFTLLKANGTFDGSKGFLINYCNGITLDNVIVQENKDGGILLLNATNNILKNIMVYNNAGKGYNETGYSNGNQLISAVFRNNSGTAVTQIGASSRLVGVCVGVLFYSNTLGAKTIS